MKIKTVKSVLSKKIKHWVNHIDSSEVKEAIENHAIVSGGAIVSMLMGEKVNDFDIYFRTPHAAKVVASYYVAMFLKNPPSSFRDDGEVEIGVQEDGEQIKIVVKSEGMAGENPTSKSHEYFESLSPNETNQEAFEYVEKIMNGLNSPLESETNENTTPPYRPVFLTSNAITLSNDIQIVIRFTGEYRKIHENYDFTHCKCAYDFSSGEINMADDALECMLNKDLRYTTSKYPLCSIIRIRKFLDRGWHINAGQIVKMAWDLNQLDLSNVDVLEDQMIGVDSAYFREVIGLLRQQQEAGNPVDGTYLMQVIDRIF